MIVIDYDSSPEKSIFYLSAKLYKFINESSNDFEEVRKYFKNNLINNDLMFYYSMDWLFLIGKIQNIEKGKIICV